MPVFTDRQRRILATLHSCGGWVCGRDLAESTGTSRRTLQQDVKNINLSVGHGLIRSNHRLGYLLDGDLPEIAAPKAVVPQGQYSTSKALVLVLLFESDCLHIDELAERLFVSRSTVNAHLARARRIVSRNREAQLVVSPRKGLWIDAGEETKRLLCAKIMNEDLDYAAMLGMPQLKELTHLEEELRELLPPILRHNDLLISGQAFQCFARFLAISITRSRLGMRMPELQTGQEPSRFIRELSDAVHRRLGYEFGVAEKELIRQRSHELNLIAKKPVRDDEIIRSITAFESAVRQQTGIALRFQPDLRRNMVDHLKRLRRRILSEHNDMGQYTKEMFATYPLTVHLIRTCLEPILGWKIPDAEIEHLTMYVACAMRQACDKVDVLLVSDAGAAFLYSIRQAVCAGDQVGAFLALPRYAFELDRETYLAKNQVHLTTEASLTLESADFLSLSVFPSELQLAQVSSAIKARQEQRRQKQQARMQNTYPLAAEPGGRDFYDGYVAPALLDPSRHVSAVTVGDALLCVVEHGGPGPCEMRRFVMEKPLDFHGKRITGLVYAAYRGGEDAVAFFAHLRHVLQTKSSGNGT